jgi:membrane fusion protein
MSAPDAPPSTHAPHSDEASSLFRQEVLSARADTAAGAAITIRPVGASLFTAFAAALCLAVLGVLIFGQYTKKERVQGVVQPRDGVAMVMAPEVAVVSKLLVKDGQVVKAGDVIAELRNERFTDTGGGSGSVGSNGSANSGNSASSQIESNLQGQQAQLQNQVEGQAQAHQAALDGLASRIDRGQRDVRSLRDEQALQREQIASARKLLDQMQPLLAERIVSQLQYEQQRQALLDQTARQQSLQRQLSAAEADLAQAKDERARLVAEHRVARAGLSRDLLSLQNESVQRRSNRVTLLKAPVDGVVTSLTTGLGQTVSPNAALAAIVPAHSPMEAVLYLPSTAMGFIKEGQSVRVSFDAFPFQRFGQYHGVVSTVSQSDVAVPSGQQGQDRRAVFLVRVKLDSPSVKAYGTEIPLRPGHTLTADIEIDRRSLLRWMFDPLFAFSGRL